jgi:hypothetical protein
MAGYPGAWGGPQTLLGITSPTVVKTTPGNVINVSVIVDGTTPGTVNDANTTASANNSNAITTLPSPSGQQSILDITQVMFPCKVGIVVIPGTGQTIAICFS